MNKQQTITINGVSYDAHSGVRLSDPAVTVPETKRVVAARDIHTKVQRTNTLARKHVRSAQPRSLLQEVVKAPATNPQITKFAQDIKPVKRTVTQDIAPIQHPVQQTVSQAPRMSQPTAVPKPSQTSRQIKEQAIAKAVSNSVSKPAPKTSLLSRHPRAFSIATASLAIVMIAGYLTYTNLPSLSVRVAAVQAGIDAQYPSYQPSGYSISGPVNFSAGEVAMKFAANGGPQSFNVEQTKSNWDSTALLENYVKEKSNNDYTTYADSGITVYVYGSNAAWVNGGILHTINGNAPLSNDQIRRIATSM